MIRLAANGRANAVYQLRAPCATTTVGWEGKKASGRIEDVERATAYHGNRPSLDRKVFARWTAVGHELSRRVGRARA